MIGEFIYQLRDPAWHCKIGKIRLKCGWKMTVPFQCGDLHEA